MEDSYQNDGKVVNDPPNGEEKSSSKSITFVVLCVLLISGGALLASFQDKGKSTFVSEFENKAGKRSTVSELNGYWFIDKYTASIAIGSAYEVKNFMNTYITDTPEFQFFGCPNENITTKVVSFVGGGALNSEVCTELHWIDSKVYPDGGALTVGDWADYIFDIGVDTFNVYMHNKIQLFVPDLSSHYATMIASGDLMGQALLRLSNSTGGDGNDVAHILVQLPHCGTFYEVVGPSSSLDASVLSGFSEWATDECPSTHVLPKALQTHISIYEALTFTDSNIAWTDSTGLPVPMVITISIPASSTDYIQDTMDIYSDLLLFDVSYSGDASTCEMYTVDVSITGLDDYSEENTPAVRYVVNHLASQGSTYSLSDWETDIATTHNEYLTSDGSGWDRYLDSHIGLFNYKNDDRTAECTIEVDTVIAGMSTYGVLSGPREEGASLHWYAGVKGLSSLELNMGCAANYSNVCGCIPANNYLEYFDETGEECY